MGQGVDGTMTKAELKRLARANKVASIITNWLWELEKRVEALERMNYWHITYKDGKKLRQFRWEPKR